MTLRTRIEDAATGRTSPPTATLAADLQQAMDTDTDWLVDYLVTELGTEAAKRFILGVGDRLHCEAIEAQNEAEDHERMVAILTKHPEFRTIGDYVRAFVGRPLSTEDSDDLEFALRLLVTSKPDRRWVAEVLVEEYGPEAAERYLLELIS